LIILRSILLGLLLLLLVRPVLLITLEETIRRPLLVLLDTTQSMGLADRRSNPDDLARAAIATGLIDPAGGLKQAAPPAPRICPARTCSRPSPPIPNLIFGHGFKLAPA